MAGAKGNVTFSRSALAAIYRISGGIPRVINLICERALLAGFVKQASLIEVALIRDGLKSLRGNEAEPVPLPRSLPMRPVTLGTMGLALGVLLTLTFLRAPLSAMLEALPFFASAPPVIEGQLASANHPYTIYVESYQHLQRTLAEQQVQQLQRLGYEPYLVTVEVPKKGTWHRVLVGRFQSQEAAQTVIQLLKRQWDLPNARVMTTANMFGDGS